ncbi:hypothetical protein ACFCVU_04670 [Peribacillus butanolivorans]|uniref:hypothetical protein n=1 Tax=Peribacillus butanolivorans TaxID=421767 RepID=UPI0035DEABD7
MINHSGKKGKVQQLKTITPYLEVFFKTSILLLYHMQNESVSVYRSDIVPAKIEPLIHPLFFAFPMQNKVKIPL